MYREAGIRKLQKTYISRDIYQRDLLAMLGKQTQNHNEGDMKEIISKS